MVKGQGEFRVPSSEFRVVRVSAPAKVNLGLDLIRKRPDGYHEIATVMQEISLCDEVRLAVPFSGKGISLIVRGPRRRGIGPAADNLCVRAARAFLDRAGLCVPLRIELAKRIPPGAGLGGGSSDAAATLAGLCRLFPGRLGPGALRSLAAGTGSDVPFFLRGGTALCSGRGERIRPVPAVGNLHYVLVLPGVGVPTREAYRAAALRKGWRKRRNLAPIAARALARGDLAALARDLTNDLEPAALRVAPNLARVRRRMERLPFLAVSMSGSGSAFYGLCRSARQARRFASRLRRLKPRIGEILAVRTFRGLESTQ